MATELVFKPEQPHVAAILVHTFKDGSVFRLNTSKEAAQNALEGFQGRWAKEAEQGYTFVSVGVNDVFLLKYALVGAIVDLKIEEPFNPEVN